MMVSKLLIRVAGQLMQILPGEETGFVTVVKSYADGIMSDWLGGENVDVLLVIQRDRLTWAMPLDFGGRTLHSQKFEGN